MIFCISELQVTYCENCLDESVQIVKAVAESYPYFKSFVIVHDYYRLDYIASGFSLLCKNLRKHVVFTGGLDALNTPNSDSAKNLLLALLVASKHVLKQTDSRYLK